MSDKKKPKGVYHSRFGENMKYNLIYIVLGSQPDEEISFSLNRLGICIHWDGNTTFPHWFYQLLDWISWRPDYSPTI
jgi:hypothetical protein